MGLKTICFSQFDSRQVSIIAYTWLPQKLMPLDLAFSKGVHSQIWMRSVFFLCPAKQGVQYGPPP